MNSIIVTAFVAISCGYILLRAKVPGGMIIGAVLGTLLLNLCTDYAYMPKIAKVVAQICAGAFVACSLEKGELKSIIKIRWAVLLILGCLVVLNLLMGTLLYALTDLDKATCYFCVVPGGLSDTPIIADEMGANASIVLVAQFIRVVVGLIVFPLISMLSKNVETPDIVNDAKPIPTEVQTAKRTSQFTITCLLAAAGGMLGKYLSFPAGILVFSMLGVLIYNIATGKAYMPKYMRHITQALSGAYIGCSMERSSFQALGDSVAAVVAICCAYVGGCLVIAWLLQKVCRFSKKSAFLCATPAGASDVALIASDLRISVPEVTTIQIIRMVFAVSVFPQIINCVLKLNFR